MSGEMHSKSRLSIFQAALVVARRDFVAVLFSKAFFFFLIGPIFFLGISGGAAMLGASAADRASPPALALAMEEPDSTAFLAAHEELAEFARMPDLAVDESYASAEPVELLATPDRNIAAVLTGTIEEPRLVGPGERIEAWSGEVALIASRASGERGGNYPEVGLESTETSVANQRSNKAKIATGSLTLLFLLTMLLAGMVLSNLVEEKGNKIIEILAAAVPMDAVFLGKLFAMLAISFVGISVWGSVIGVIMLLGGESFDLPTPAVGWGIFVPLFLAYFAMAYLLIGSIFLAIGSLAPTVRDVQTISMPATMLQLGVFFLATYAMSDTGSPAELFAVAFPLSSPYAMLARAAQEPVLWWHVAALAWQVLWVAIFVRAGATLFRKKVMKSGPRNTKRKGWFKKGEKPA
ncbi:ABC transporter permease [Erythrobacter sp. HKB08]|uniref:ABC transporter permease n=1 Tax=Erythrobacter sp. HKB08 TaxID=2502843 RepID=UPI00100929E0|nr:ABC transporter permease [Erythrobacter sp. HKB08]